MQALVTLAQSLRHAGERSTHQEPASNSRPAILLVLANSRITAFTIRCATRRRTRQHETVDLGEQKTDADGKAELDLQLDRFADATYAMQFLRGGFEGEGGRSITGQASLLVSALPYVVGYKADGDLNYINARHAARRRSRRRRSAAQ